MIRMPIFNLSALIYSLQSQQLREFDASRFEKIVDVNLGQDLAFKGALLAATILPNGQLIGLTMEFLQIFDLDTNTCVKQFPLPQEKYFHCREAISGLHALPDGNKVLITLMPRYNHSGSRPNKPGSYEIWDITSGQCILRLEGGPMVLASHRAALELHLRPGIWQYSGDQSTASFNPIDANLWGWESSSRALHNANCLKTIRFKLEPLTYQDLLPLLQAMCYYPDVVRHLSLRHMKWDDHGFQHIVAFIKTSTRLKSLNLEETTLSEYQQAIVRDFSVQKKFKIIGLNIENISLLKQPIGKLTDLWVAAEELPILPEPPARYLCPITQEIMLNPVIAFDGYTYEADVIQKHLSIKSTSPMLNTALVDTRLIPNLNLRSEIREFLENNPHYWQQVYFSEEQCHLVETACRDNNIAVLQQFLQQDRRFLTRPIVMQPKKFLIEILCEHSTDQWTTLFPAVIKLLKPSEWQSVLAQKPLVNWLKWIAEVNAQVARDGIHTAVQSFIIAVETALSNKLDCLALFLYALQEQHQPLLRLSLALLGDINQPMDTDGHTLFHNLVQNPDTSANRQAMTYLIAYGADPHVKNRHGLTAIEWCEQNGFSSMAEFIRQAVQKHLVNQYIQESGLTQQIMALTQQVTYLQAEVVKQQNIISAQQTLLERQAISQLEPNLGDKKHSEIAFKEEIAKLSNKIAALEYENRQAKQEKNSRLQNVLTGDIKAKLYSPQKTYLRQLFLATTPEFATVDETITAEITAQKAEAARQAALNQQDALVEACALGELNKVISLHQAGASFEASNRQGEYALVAACRVLAVPVIQYIDQTSSIPERLWLIVGEDTNLMEMWNKKIVNTAITPVTNQTTYADFDKILNDHIAPRSNKLPIIEGMIADWDRIWSKGCQHVAYESCYTYLEQKTSAAGQLKPLSVRSVSKRDKSDEQFSGSSTNRYYGSEIRSKKTQLIQYVNECLKEIEQNSHIIRGYQQRIYQFQRLQSCSNLKLQA